MSDFPPYLNGHSYISKVLEAVKAAKVPPKFTQDFLGSKLGIKSASARPIIPFLKRIGFLSEAGIPTQRYTQFRNPSLSGKAIAAGLKEGYADLYEVNEYAHELHENELEGLVLQVSNAEKGQTSTAVVKSFMALKQMANFDDSVETEDNLSEQPLKNEQILPTNVAEMPNNMGHQSRRMNLSYTINLNLPETTNPEVFDAIFQSLNRNILKVNDE